MISKNTNSQSQTFIIRIWKERVLEDGMVDYWHGAIDQVGHNKRLYFYNLDSISRFIQEQTGVSEKVDKPWWRAVFSKITREVVNGYKSIKNGLRKELRP
jgi:hypothetical protein